MSRRERQRRRRRKQGGPARIFFLGLGLITTVAVIGGLAAIGWVLSIAASAPSLDELKAVDQGTNSVVYAADGTKLGVIQADILRSPIPSSSMPRVMREATVAIEDRRFFKHGGVDLEGIVRAAIKNAESGSTVQGGSTLTMQLIKNLYDEDRTRTGVAGYKRKIREAKLAQDLEDRHPGGDGKQWILTKYLNNVPYGTVGGQTAVGVQAAARVFFNKRAGELTLSEAALLAGLPQAPTAYNPYLNRARAIQRRNEVLKQMRKAGYITDSQYADAVSAGVELHQSTYYRQRRESYFFDYVRKELVNKYGLARVRQGGLKVYTTVDLRLQRLARAAISKNLSAPGSPSSALVSIDPKTGYIKAMASSSNYGDSEFNLAAQGKRQPGSTFKIMVLMTALRRGVDIKRTSYQSHPLNFIDEGTGAKIDVKNSDGGSCGCRRSIFDAVIKSDNTVFQQLDLDVGPKAVAETAHDMGITSELHGYPAEGLGGLTYGVSPLEMTRAYVTVNNGGYRLKPIAITKVAFPDGKIDTSLGRDDRTKVFTDGETYEAIQAMKGNVQSGTGTAANLGFCPAAGKTGTTSSFVDAWFDGFTSNLNTAVWVGYPGQNISMNAVPGWGTMFGGRAPATIWHDFMTGAVNRKGCHDWAQPKDPFVAEPFFGKYAKQGAPGDKSQYEKDGALGTQDKKKDSDGKDGNGGTGTTTNGTSGGTKYPPSAYETPPQTDQPVQTPPAGGAPPTPTTPAPGTGGDPGAGGAPPADGGPGANP